MKKDVSLAFPASFAGVVDFGLTKREYIAIEMMKPLINSTALICVELEKAGDENNFGKLLGALPARAFELADILIEEGKKD